MSQDPNQPNKSGGMSTVMIVLIVLGVLFLLCAGICGGCVYLGVKEGGHQLTELIVLSDPAGNAQREIQASMEATDKYGTPINFGPPMREGNTKGEINLADVQFAMTVEGNGNKGTAHVKAKQVDAQWTLTEITINCTDGTIINVPVSGEVAPPNLNFGDGSEEMPEDKK